MKNRIDTFDILKGIGIILMVIGHTHLDCDTPIVSRLNQIIYSFHMPLFFLISGYFFKPKPFNIGIKGYFKRLIIPYIFTIIIILSIAIIQSVINKDFDNIIKWGIAALWGNGSNMGNALFHDVKIIGAIWFLLSMFWTLNIFNILTNKLKSRLLLISVLLISIVGYLSAQYVRIPFNIQSGMMCVFFLYIGNILKTKDIFNNIPIWIAALFILSWVIITPFSFFSLASCTMSHFPLEIIASLGGVLLTYYISKFISEKGKIIKETLVKFGESTLVILCFHNIDIMIFAPYYQSYVNNYLSFALLILVRLSVYFSFIFLVRKYSFLKMVFYR